MRELESGFVGRTFDDFLFRPRHGVVETRRDVGLALRFSRRIALELPIVSANMDSVTGARMARTMALEGGLGIVHRAMPIDAQAAKVGLVKRSHGHVIEHPHALPRDATQAIKFTGGTTGLPKGVMQPYHAWNAGIVNQIASWELTEDDRYVVAAPVTHGTGTYLLPVLAQGGTHLLLDTVNPASITAAFTRVSTQHSL